MFIASLSEPKPTQPPEFSPDSDDVTLLKSLAEKSRELNNETPKSDSTDGHYTHDETDSTKNRRLADDYDTTKNGLDNKYQGNTSNCATTTTRVREMTTNQSYN